MKRTFLIWILIVLITAAILPTAAVADAEREIAADHVLIYNPLPYDKTSNKLFTGTLPKQEESEDPTGTEPFSPGLHQTGMDYSLVRKEGDTYDFWVCTDLTTYTYDKFTFRLGAQSEHCSVWTPVQVQENVFDAAQLTTIAEQFESIVYPSNTEHFGTFRDLGGNGKLNIVTYEMNSFSVCGFFDRYDLYSAEEIAVIDPDDAGSYNCLPIINVNARMSGQETTVLGTLAHEFQHLILQSAVLASPANADRLGNEIAPGTWINEAFSMEAEELAFPGSVEEQGYLDAYRTSRKVAGGMSFMNFDAVSTDVGAYGQSYLFAEYLKTQCGEDVFRTFTEYWRQTEDTDALKEAFALYASLSDAQKASLDALCMFTEGTELQLGSDPEILFSKLGLAFRIAILLKQENGLFAIGKEQPEMPVYTSTGREIEGGGAILLECSGSFTVPADADSGLIFVGLRDGTLTRVFTVPEPEDGYYALAANYDGKWYAIPASPSQDGILLPMEVSAPIGGIYAAGTVRGAVFKAEKQQDGTYRFACRDASGAYMLARVGQNKQELAVQEEGTPFAWRFFADGAVRLQADGRSGRAILYGDYQHGFGYFPSAYFENASFAKLQAIPVYTVRKGDVNRDGRITAADVALTLRSVVGLSTIDALQAAAADLDGDGAATAADAARIMRIVVLLEPEPEEDSIQ